MQFVRTRWYYHVKKQIFFFCLFLDELDVKIFFTFNFLAREFSQKQTYHWRGARWAVATCLNSQQQLWLVALNVTGKRLVQSPSWLWLHFPNRHVRWIQRAEGKVPSGHLAQCGKTVWHSLETYICKRTQNKRRRSDLHSSRDKKKKKQRSWPSWWWLPKIWSLTRRSCNFFAFRHLYKMYRKLLIWLVITFCIAEGGSGGQVGLAAAAE